MSAYENSRKFWKILKNARKFWVILENFYFRLGLFVGCAWADILKNEFTLFSRKYDYEN